jgi:hypothetical protein
MFFRKAALVVTVLLIVAALGVVSWIWSSKNRLYSSPTVIRTNDAYSDLFIAVTNFPPRPTNLLESIQIDRSTNQIRFTYPGSYKSTDTPPGALQIDRARATEPIALNEGSLRLATIGTAFAEPRTNFDYVQIPAKYFTPDLKPRSAPAAEILPTYEHQIYFHGEAPTYQFVFAASNLTELKPLGLNVFDARTHFRLESGHGSSWQSNSYWFETSLTLWHQTPVEVFLTVATGPTVSYSIDKKEGFEVEYPGGQITLLMITDQELANTRTSSDGRTNVATYELGTRNPYYKDKDMCSFLFYSWPQSYSLPIEFEFFDASGKKIPGYRSSSSRHLITQTILSKLDQVKEIRMKHFPNLHRLIYTLPELPGLPEENRNLENLFDVHVPYVYFRYEHAFQDTIGRLLQMEPQMLRLTYPNNFFPTFRTNTTGRELFLELESMLVNKELQLSADPQKNTISAKPHPIAAAVDAIKKKLGL